MPTAHSIYSVYPQDREYETRRVARKRRSASGLAEKHRMHCGGGGRASAMRVVAAVQASVSAGREAITGAKAQFGWQFLTNAIARYGFDGAYQKIQHFGDDFTHRDELPGRPVKCSGHRQHAVSAEAVRVVSRFRPTQRRFAGAGCGCVSVMAMRFGITPSRRATDGLRPANLIKLSRQVPSP